MSKKLIIFLVILLVLLGLSFVFWYFIKNTKADISSSEKFNPPVNSPVSLIKNPDDLDNDGINNTDEDKLGLDPISSDTDGDGLNDDLEINIWKTDPLNPDTDADGFSDGREVSEGYNPLGPGKLE